jgi:MoaA/NifB/PqqE/SkfB family radical SAM enzyme
MEKIKLEHIDIPIIRSCNLACVGCMTHSNHKNIKGTIRIDESREWLKFWAERIEPKTITLFGGEPLLHPEFTEWALTIREIFGPNIPISLNTNGYYLDVLLKDIDKLFNEDIAMSMVVSVQTGTEPYLSKVKENIEIVKQAILDYRASLPGVTNAKWDLWLDETDINTKKWFRMVVNGKPTRIGFTTCDQYRLPWCTHYTGIGEEMLPVYNYNDSWYEQNHARCQTNSFVTLFKGRMWKCPPMGVIEHTLNTFNIADNPAWEPFIKDYKTVGPESTDKEIQEWVERQKNPEKVCNMCGFEGPNGASITGDERSHILKNYWNYKL